MAKNLEHSHIQMLAIMWSHRIFRLLLMGTNNGAIPLEDYLEVSYKTKYTLTL